MALLGGNAAAGELQTMYDGPRPPPARHGVKPGKGYQPMKKQVGQASELSFSAALACHRCSLLFFFLAHSRCCCRLLLRCQGAIILGIGGKLNHFSILLNSCFAFGTLSNQAKDGQINLACMSNVIAH